METRRALFSSWTSFYNSSLDCARNDVQEIRQTRPTHRKLKKIRKARLQTNQTRDGGGGQGPHLREQDLGRTIRDTGEREWGAHRASRDTEGGLGRGHPHRHTRQGPRDSPLVYRTNLHPAARGQARATYWLRTPSSPAPDKGQRQAGWVTAKRRYTSFLQSRRLQENLSKHAARK